MEILRILNDFWLSRHFLRYPPRQWGGSEVTVHLEPLFIQMLTIVIRAYQDTSTNHQRFSSSTALSTKQPPPYHSFAVKSSSTVAWLTPDFLYFIIFDITQIYQFNFVLILAQWFLRLVLLSLTIEVIFLVFLHDECLFVMFEFV